MIVKEDTKVIFGGMSQTIYKGTKYRADSEMVKLYPNAFIKEVSKESIKVSKINKEKVIQVTEEVPAIKEEILIEQPLEVQVTEEVTEEVETDTEEKPKRTRRRK